MDQNDLDLVHVLQQQERERLDGKWPVPPAAEPPTIHWTNLPEGAAGGRLSLEWNFYRKQVGRLLAEGLENRWVLIKGEEIIGSWDTENEADLARLQRFPLQDVLLRQVCQREPILRSGAYYRPWTS